MQVKLTLPVQVRLLLVTYLLVAGCSSTGLQRIQPWSRVQ